MNSTSNVLVSSTLNTPLSTTLTVFTGLDIQTINIVDQIMTNG